MTDSKDVSENVENPEISVMTEKIVSENILSDVTFSDYQDKLSPETYKAIQEMGFQRLTEIQAKTIPILMEGK